MLRGGRVLFIELLEYCFFGGECKLMVRFELFGLFGIIFRECLWEGKR